jgi:hypothetical protein
MSSSLVSRRSHAAVLPVFAALIGAAGAYAATDRGPDTTAAVSSRVLIAAPDRSPVDFPGVARARAGAPLPAGYVAVGRAVRLTRGAEVAHVALALSCPGGKTWRTGSAAGDISVTVLDRAVSRKRAVLVMASFHPRETAVGQTAAGTVYALCR